jgi:RimJ/RimL family protein N-acetyltransferase
LTELLPAVVGQLLEDRVGRIGAAVNRRNIANRKVLKKAGFERKHVFDLEQDFYEIGFH